MHLLVLIITSVFRGSVRTRRNDFRHQIKWTAYHDEQLNCRNRYWLLGTTAMAGSTAADSLRFLIYFRDSKLRSSTTHRGSSDLDQRSKLDQSRLGRAIAEQPTCGILVQQIPEVLEQHPWVGWCPHHTVLTKFNDAKALCCKYVGFPQYRREWYAALSSVRVFCMFLKECDMACAHQPRWCFRWAVGWSTL